MASTSETGHNKNVANFMTAYQILEEMGSIYKPSNENLLLPNLEQKKQALSAVMTALNDKKPIYKNVVASRENTIARLGKTMTKVLSYTRSLNISDTDKENIANQIKKIRGDKKTKKIDPANAEVATISTSQMSYDSRIANLATVIKQLASHPEYNPNETEIQIESLQAYQLELSDLSTVVNAAGNTMISTRNNRNKELYADDQNIIDLMKGIKSYVKSLGEVGKPYYKALVKLKFTNILS